MRAAREQRLVWSLIFSKVDSKVASIEFFASKMLARQYCLFAMGCVDEGVGTYPSFITKVSIIVTKFEKSFFSSALLVTGPYPYS